MEPKYKSCGVLSGQTSDKGWKMITPEKVEEFVVSPAALRAEVIAKCGCGKEYTAELWDGLKAPPKGGIQHVPCDPTDAEREPAYDIELKNCAACDSTLAWQTPECYCGKDKDDPRCACSVTRTRDGDTLIRADKRCKIHGSDE